MKLSKLKELVAQLEAHSAPGADPNVRFWIPRPEGFKALEKDSEHFVEFDITTGGDIQNTAWSNRVVAVAECCLAQKGDFDLPLHNVPFYK